MENKEKFYKTDWFLILLCLFLPIVGLIWMWIFHKEKSIGAKIIITILLIVCAYLEMDVQNTIDTLEHQNNAVVEQQVETSTETVEVENELEKTEIIEETKVEDLTVVENNEDVVEEANSINLLLNINQQDLPMMNGTKTERIGTVLKFVGDSSLFAQSSVEDLKEFIEVKIKPIEKDYNYVVIDFLSGDTGLIYRYGLFEYGKLHKENHEYYFESENDIYGTFSIYDDKELQDLLDMIVEKENI